MPPGNLMEKGCRISGLIGLVLCGGASSRMGRDKSFLVYREKPQWLHLFELLEKYCEKVFISCNSNQSGLMDPSYPLLTDLPQYQSSGPITGLLTAFNHLPGSDFLVVGCDYPYLDEQDLENFLNCCNHGKPAAFFNEKEDLYEPLLGYYPGRYYDKMVKMTTTQNYSLQYFLKMNHALKYFPADSRSICSIDTFEAHIKTKVELKNKAFSQNL